MTIIKSRQNSYSFFTIIIFVLVLISAIFYIFEYNSFVNIRYQVKNLKGKIIETQQINADSKSQLYGLIDPVKLEPLAKNYNLVLDKEPEYLLSSLKSSSSTLTTSL